MNRYLERTRILAHNLIFYSRYRPWGKNVDPRIIYMIDGSVGHAGLADRLRQIMGIYALCKYHSYKFGLVANHPFELSDYLSPRYDWKIAKHDFSKNLFYARPIYLGYRSMDEYKSVLKLKNRQLHVYVCVQWSLPKEFGYTWKQLFWELFNPVSEIKDFIKGYKDKYHTWDSLHFRFINLLGDFNEPQSHKLSNAEKDDLSNKCFNYVREEAKRSSKYLLVCSDSNSFLKKVSKIPKVFVLPGEPIHIDHTQDNSYEMHLKNFLDFFMISESESVRSVSASNMYRSDFPVLAASINNASFERVELK